MARQPVHFLHPHADRRAALGAIIDRVTAACGGGVIGGSELFEQLPRRPVEQPHQRIGKPTIANIAQTARAIEQRFKPQVETVGERARRQRVEPGKGRALAQRLRRGPPADQTQPFVANRGKPDRHIIFRARIAPGLAA